MWVCFTTHGYSFREQPHLTGGSLHADLPPGRRVREPSRVPIGDPNVDQVCYSESPLRVRTGGSLGILFTNTTKTYIYNGFYN